MRRSNRYPVPPANAGAPFQRTGSTWSTLNRLLLTPSERSLPVALNSPKLEKPAEAFPDIDRLARTSEKGLRSELGDRWVNEASQLLDLQLWCWGMDIRAAGNLLLQAGARKTPCPRPHPCGSRYEWGWEESTLVLWGHGISFGNARNGRLFLRRSGFAPLLANDPRRTDFGWSIDELPELKVAAAEDRPQLHALLTLMIAAIIELESRLTAVSPTHHRQLVITSWKKRGSNTPMHLVTAWQKASDELEGTSP